MSQSDQPFCKPLTHAWFGENVNPTGKICLYKEQNRMESIFLEYSFWCMMVLFCKKWDSSALWERKWFLEVWKGCFLNRVSEEPHFLQNEIRCKNYPCADHNLLSTWHYWGTTYILCERPFCKWSWTKSKWLKKNAREAFFQVELSVVFGGWMKLNV